MRCGSVSLIFKRTLQPFNIKGPLKKIPRWKKEGKADLYLILENHLYNTFLLPFSLGR